MRTHIVYCRAVPPGGVGYVGGPQNTLIWVLGGSFWAPWWGRFCRWDSGGGIRCLKCNFGGIFSEFLQKLRNFFCDSNDKLCIFEKILLFVVVYFKYEVWNYILIYKTWLVPVVFGGILAKMWWFGGLIFSGGVPVVGGWPKTWGWGPPHPTPQVVKL